MYAEDIMSKTKWKTPELIILTKGQPEENILEQCKSVHGPASSTVYSVSGQNCKNFKGTCGACQAEGGTGS